MGDPTATTGTGTRATPAKESFSLTDAYLLLYNTACAVGWNLTLYKIGTALLEGGGVRDAVSATHDLVVALQLLSTLEFVHACAGLVRGLRKKSHLARYRASVIQPLLPAECFFFFSLVNWSSSTLKMCTHTST